MKKLWSLLSNDRFVWGIVLAVGSFVLSLATIILWVENAHEPPLPPNFISNTGIAAFFIGLGAVGLGIAGFGMVVTGFADWMNRGY